MVFKRASHTAPLPSALFPSAFPSLFSCICDSPECRSSRPGSDHLRAIISHKSQTGFAANNMGIKLCITLLLVMLLASHLAVGSKVSQKTTTIKLQRHTRPSHVRSSANDGSSVRLLNYLDAQVGMTLHAWGLLHFETLPSTAQLCGGMIWVTWCQMGVAVCQKQHVNRLFRTWATSGMFAWSSWCL